MRTKTGSLLTRNQPAPGVQVVKTETVDQVTVDFDPLSPNFKPPQWLLDEPTPWKLIGFLDYCLTRKIVSGKPTRLKWDYKVYLRGAKKLIANTKNIVEAARIVAYAAEHCGIGNVPSFKFVLKCEEEVKEKLCQTI